MLDEKFIEATYPRNYGCKWYFKDPTAEKVKLASMQMGAEVRNKPWAAENKVYCSLQDPPERENMRNDLKAVRNYVKEQLEARDYKDIELRTVTYTRRIEIVKAEKGDIKIVGKFKNLIDTTTFK